MKDDKGKARWDLLPFAAMEEVVEVLTFGAEKYSPDNWRTVVNARKRYLAAAFRHMAAWARGEHTDKESGLSPLAHAVCCLLFVLELEHAELERKIAKKSLK